MKIINKAFNLVGKLLKGLIKWFKDAGMELIATIQRHIKMHGPWPKAPL